MKTDSSVARAVRWLCASGIQNRSRNDGLSGGVAAWYELDKEIYPFLYSEITGYALAAFIFFHKKIAGNNLTAHARPAARWLARHALHPEGGVKTRFYLVDHYVSPNYSFHRGRIYAFDTAMVGYGLLQLLRVASATKARHQDVGGSARDVWRTSADLRPDAALEEAVHRIARFLLETMQKKNGLFFPFYDPKKKRCGEELGKWSDQAGTFHAKLALFFADYHRFTRQARFKKAATRLLDRTLTMQKKDGRFVTGQKDGSTHLHPHSYTLEGLLYGGLEWGRDDYVQAALRGFLWMLEGVSADGSVSSVYRDGTFSHHERSDIVAQVLRLGSALYAVRRAALVSTPPLLKRVREHLLLFQHRAATPQDGGFLYGADTDGLMRVHLNAWSTMFAAQALWMHREFVERGMPVRLESFV